MAMSQDFNLADQSAEFSPESSGAAMGEVVRDYKPKEGVSWRFGRPNYARVNKAYFDGRTKIWNEGSLEWVVSMVVKNWEVESHHIYKPEDWKTMDITKFKASVNGGTVIGTKELSEAGPYNVLLGDMKGYTASKETFESANKIFSNVFTEGFAWECLEVYSGPPQVSFKWRHFGKFTGEYVDADGKKHKGDGKLIEVYGIVIATVNHNLVIEELQIFYQLDTMIAPLMTGVCPGVA